MTLLLLSVWGGFYLLVRLFVVWSTFAAAAFVIVVWWTAVAAETIGRNENGSMLGDGKTKGF